MKTNPLEKMKKRSPRTRFFWCYTLGFLLCAAGCYCWFLIKGKTPDRRQRRLAPALCRLCVPGPIRP